jgi:peptide/nickel transport system permease protein
MGQYIVRRLLYAVIVICVAGIIAFFLVHLAPGDPAALILGSDATVDQIENLRSQMGLDRPIPVQFAKWFGGILQGDFGESIYFHKPVLQVIAGRAEPTLLLTVLSASIVALLGISIGTISAVKYGTIADQGLTGAAIFSAAIPSFWLGMVFILIFGVILGWFPTSGYEPIAEGNLAFSLYHLVLPAFCLGIPNSALVIRVTRSTMLDEINKDYLRTLRAKGLRESVVVLRHALRNSLVPILTVIGLTVAILIGGAVVTENVYAIPGLGRLVVQSVLRRDFPVIQGVVMMTAFVFLFINLIVDILYVFIDPRIKY